MDDIFEKVAKDMWADGNPNTLKEGVLERDLGNGFTLEHDLLLDWEMNRETYIRLAQVALVSFRKHTEKDKGM